MRVRNRRTHSGPQTARIASDQINAVATGCCSGQGAPAGSAVGLPTMRRLSAVAADERRFERGLQILLDGIELEIERRRAKRAADA